MLEAKEPNPSTESVDPNENTSRNQVQEFTEEALTEAWDALRSLLKKDPEKTSLYNALSANHPKLLDNNKISLEVYSPIQVGQIDENKEEVMEYLKNKLQNDLIELETSLVTTQDDKSKMLYTDHDKFKAMKEKNEALEYLRLKFNLDIEF